MEKIQEAQGENKAEAKSEVEEYKEKEMLTVETVSNMDIEITQVEETVDVVPIVSEINDQEGAPQQSSVEPPKVQELKTTPQDDETMENSTVMLTVSEAKVVLIDMHRLSPNDADDNHGEICTSEQEGMKHTMPSEQQAAEETMTIEEQDSTLDTKLMEEPACTTTTEEYDVAADANRSLEQSTAYKEQEGEPEPETAEVALQSLVEKPEEKADTEQANKDEQDSDKLFPKPGKQTQEKGSIDTPSRFTSFRDQPVEPELTVRSLRSTLKPIKITPVKRSRHSKAVIQQAESVKTQLRTDENPERDEVIAEGVGPKENEMENTNIDETASAECGSSELLKAAETNDKEKEPKITKTTEEIPLKETEAEEDVTENRVKDITTESMEADLAGQTDSDIEISSLSQEIHVQEEEVPISTERHLRRRTIRVKSPLRRKSRREQKQKAEAVTEERVKEMENKEAHLAEMELVEEPNMSRDKYEKISATTEETVNVCIPIITTETSLESLNEMANTNIEETIIPESSELSMGVEIHDQEKEIQIVDGPEEKVSLVEPGNGADKDGGTPVIQLQRATVVLVDLNKLSQNTEEEGETSEDLTHSHMEEQLKLDEPYKHEQELSNLASEEGEQHELQTYEDTEKTPKKEKMEEENTFEEQKPTEDLATIPADGDLVESNEIEKSQNENEGVGSLAQENLKEEAPVSIERSLRRRTIKIQSPLRRKSRRVHKQEAKAFEDKARNVPITRKGVEEMLKEGPKVHDKEETLKKSTLETTEVFQVVEVDHEEHEVRKGFEDMMENKKTNLTVTKDTDKEALEVGEETNVEQEENEPLVKNKETAEAEKPMEIDPVVSKEQITIQIEETSSQVESTETSQSDNERITRRSLRLSTKSVTPTQKTRKSTRLHKVEMEPVKKTNMNRNEHDKTSATIEETVNVCIVESNLKSLDEMANTNVEETTPFEPETSEILMGVEINDTEQASQIVEEVPPIEAEPGEEVEKDDGTLVILQEDTPVLVDLNQLSQNTEETDTPEVLTLCHTEEQLEICEPDKSEHEPCNLTSEEEEQDMTVEGQKQMDVLVGEEREIVEEYKVVIDENVEESVASGEHPKATTMEDQTNLTPERENDQDISLKEKQIKSDVEMRSVGKEAPKAVQEILEEEGSVSTERSLRRRTIKIQSTPIRKSKRVQKVEAEVFEDKTGTVPLTGKGDEEMHKEGAEKDDNEETLQKSTVEATENVVSLIEGEPDEDVIEKGFQINNMDNQETNLGNEAAPQMEREEGNLEQQENEPFVENETETAETEKPMGMDEVSVDNKEQTSVIEETTIQVEEEISQMESSETNENKSERTTRRSLRISAQSGTPTQKTRKSTRLHKADLELVEEAEMSRRKETSSVSAKTANVCVPVSVENLDEDRDMVFMSKKVEATSDKQEISNDKGKVDEALPERCTGNEENETVSSIKTTENEILVEMDETQKDVEEAVQESQAESSQENTDQGQEKALSLDENVGETKLANEFKTKAVEEEIALENSEQEAAFITQSLRYRTVTVQSTPRSKSKHPHRQELESERKMDQLNLPIGKENEALIAREGTADFENLVTKVGEAIIQTNTEEKSEKSGRNDNTEKEGNEILSEIMESNSVNTEENKTQEENLEREHEEVPNKQKEEQVSNVQKEAKPLQEQVNEEDAEDAQGRSVDLEETAVERRTLRKRTTVETAAPRKSKHLRKQEHDDDSEEVEAVTGQTESAEVTFTADSVELRSDVTAAVFEGIILDEEILQKVQTNAEGAKSDGGNTHKDSETAAGESQEEQKQSRLNTNEGFTLALEIEETSVHEENKADEEAEMEASKEIFTSAELSEIGEENISDGDEKGLAIEKQSSTASTRRKSMRLLMLESKKKTKEDESDSESEAQQRHQRKRKAITDSTPARGSKRHVRGRIV
ncbi:uncharacterized protein [Garra rufa]|uniref:uncharacterized protein n=1 Tax=Garra rufa TaxID=137080 RepID=UPI003CCE9742